MAVSTHRWRPDVGVKSGYTWNRKYKKPRIYNKGNCMIELKFENSSYFVGVKNPIASIYQVNKFGTVSTNKSLDFSKISDVSAISHLDQRLTKKLYASEYVQAKNVHCLTKLNDPFVRGYMISNDKMFLEEAQGILEFVKVKFSPELWNSYRMVIVPKSCDISTDILRNDDMIQQQEIASSQDQKYSTKIEEDEEEILSDDFLFTEEESRSTNTTMDEDAEEVLRNKVASSKFRDSRIILANRPKLKPEIDPVEKCFVALTKLFEDNIFSAAKGLSELNIEITNMNKMSSYDIPERVSSDSIDINFQIK